MFGAVDSSRARAISDWISAGVILPPSLGSTSRRAPKARMVCSFSSAKASEETKCAWKPSAAQTIASELPVLPPVYSTTRPPGLS